MTIQEALKVNGRATLPHWVNYWITFIHDGFYNERGVKIDLHASEFMRKDWAPYKQCKHTPYIPLVQSCLSDNGYMNGSDVQRMIDMYQNPRCKCGVYLEATGWKRA